MSRTRSFKRWKLRNVMTGALVVALSIVGAGSAGAAPKAESTAQLVGKVKINKTARAPSRRTTPVRARAGTYRRAIMLVGMAKKRRA